MSLLELENYLHAELSGARKFERDEIEKVMEAAPRDSQARREALSMISRATRERVTDAHRTYQQTLEAYKEEHKHEWSRR